MTKTKDSRARNWTFILYPTDGNPPAPENWLEILDSLHIKTLVSPLHHAYTEGIQEERKDHYHIMIMFEGKKSYEQILEITQSLNATVPQKVKDACSLARYFLHLDNPEKEQFENGKSELISLGGLDLTGVLEINFSEKLAVLKEIMQMIDDNGITEYTHLEEILRGHINTNYYVVATCTHTNTIIAKLRSKRHLMEKGQMPK